MVEIPVSKELIEQLKRDEGCALIAYPDPVSELFAACRARKINPYGGNYTKVPNWQKFTARPWTIGFGHTGDDVKAGTVWTMEQAEAQVKKDIVRTVAPLVAHRPWVLGLSPARRDVLFNMAFNMGYAPNAKRKGLAGFTNTLALIQAGQFQEAGENMLASTWANQVGNRATRLVKQLESNEYV